MTPLERIREIAGRIAGEHGLLVDDVTMRREGKQTVLRVVLDRPGPGSTAEDSVSIADCERVSQELGTILDVEDLVPDRFTLEV
ncbi:MAG: ribosome maturation factor RimP, partial [Vicinamibacterales bacterium]